MNIYQKFERIKTLVFDVDGVFTDGKLIVTENGDLLRTVSTRDGMAIKIALQAGYDIIVITGGNSIGIKKRLEGLGIKYIFLGVDNKLPVLQNLIIDQAIDIQSVAYMGDDIPDISPLKYVGLASCPIDAIHEVSEICDFISQKKGGDGCVRDLIEKVMRAQSTWPR